MTVFRADGHTERIVSKLQNVKALQMRSSKSEYSARMHASRNIYIISYFLPFPVNVKHIKNCENIILC